MIFQTLLQLPQPDHLRVHVEELPQELQEQPWNFPLSRRVVAQIYIFTLYTGPKFRKNLIYPRASGAALALSPVAAICSSLTTSAHRRSETQMSEQTGEENKMKMGKKRYYIDFYLQMLYNDIIYMYVVHIPKYIWSVRCM